MDAKQLNLAYGVACKGLNIQSLELSDENSNPVVVRVRIHTNGRFVSPPDIPNYTDDPTEAWIAFAALSPEQRAHLAAGELTIPAVLQACVVSKTRVP